MGCEDHRTKTPFATAAKARRALEGIRRRGERRDGKPQRVYCCPNCGRHFLTSRPA